MRLFQNNNNILNPIQDSSFKFEKHIQSLIESNMETLFGLEFVSSEFPLGKFRLDSLAFDKQNNSFVIIEYKKKRDSGVIDQGHSYLRAVMNHQADCTLEYRDKTGKELKKSNVNWKSSRVIFVAQSFTIYQKNSVGDDLPFELWEIKKFNDELIAIEKYGSPFNEPPISKGPERLPPEEKELGPKKRKPDEPPISKGPKGLSEIEELKHVKKLNESLKPIWTTLKKKLQDYADTSLYSKKRYISWEKGNNTICRIYFREKFLQCEINRGKIKATGEKSKGFFTIQDPKGLIKDHSWKWKSGDTGHRYAISLEKQKSLNYVIALLEQKYNSLLPKGPPQKKSPRSPFRFSMVDIKPGAKLTFKDDENISCRVIDDKAVEFKGSQSSLTSITRDLLSEKRGKQVTTVRGPNHWLFEGEILTKMRDRIEKSEG